MKKNKFLNRYHKFLSNIFENIQEIPIISSLEMLTFENTSNLHNQSWTRSIIALPSITDFVTFLKKISQENKALTFNDQLKRSVMTNPNDWNSLFNFEQYKASLDDYFPISETYNYLINEEHSIIEKVDLKNTLELIHFKGMFTLFEELTFNPILVDILDVFVEYTNFLEILLCDQALKIRTIRWDQENVYKYIWDYIRPRKTIFNQNDEKYIFRETNYDLVENFLRLLRL